MKSPQIANVISDFKERSKYSDLQVLKSEAGWYIGTIYTNDMGYFEPGSRDSEYFPSEKLANVALVNKDWNQREFP